MDQLVCFAQSSLHFASRGNDPWLVLIITLSAVTVAVLAMTMGWMKARVAERERARILDMGFLPPPRTTRWPQALYCTAVGLVLPVAIFSIWPHDDPSQFFSWFAPTVVSGIAILGSTLVAAISLGRADRAAQTPYQPVAPAKLAADAEAFDFAGRRNSH